jgi:lysozyme family protein
MVASNFKPSLAAVLKSEGGNDDDPQDHGGRTSRGIIQREYDAWRKEHNLPVKDVWTATQQEIETIYHDEYWWPYCDLLPVGADYLLFNMNVNAGPSRGAKILQQALGVNADGRIGPVTREAIRNADPAKLIQRYSDASRAFYLGLHQPRFTNGWLNRVKFVQATALGMIKTQVASQEIKS